VEEFRILKGILRPIYPADQDKRRIYSTILKLFLPATVEFGLLQLVNIFDQIQVGGLGETATAAVGLCGQLRTIANALFIAVNIGLTALTARAMGEKRPEKFPALLQHGFGIILTISLFVSLLGFWAAEPVLRFMNAPNPETLALGTAYLKISAVGLVPLALTTAMTAMLRGVGNTRAPMVYNSVANAVNVFLNWVLIHGRLGYPQLGVNGAALATVIGQAVAFFCAGLVCFRPKNILGMSFGALGKRLRVETARDILRIGLPSMLETVLGRTGTLLFTRTVATLGTTLYATHAICINIQLLTGMAGQALAGTSTTLSGQSLGGKRQDLAVLYSVCTARLGLLISVALAALYIFLGPWMIHLYNADPAIVAAGTVPLRIVALMQPFAALQYVFAGSLRGAGDTKSVAGCYLFTQLICRPTFSYFAVRVFSLGLNGAWWSLVCAESLCAILLCRKFGAGAWLRH